MFNNYIITNISGENTVGHYFLFSIVITYSF